MSWSVFCKKNVIVLIRLSLLTDVYRTSAWVFGCYLLASWRAWHMTRVVCHPLSHLSCWHQIVTRRRDNVALRLFVCWSLVNITRLSQTIISFLLWNFCLYLQICEGLKLCNLKLNLGRKQIKFIYVHPILMKNQNKFTLRTKKNKVWESCKAPPPPKPLQPCWIDHPLAQGLIVTLELSRTMLVSFER